MRKAIVIGTLGQTPKVITESIWGVENILKLKVTRSIRIATKDSQDVPDHIKQERQDIDWVPTEETSIAEPDVLTEESAKMMMQQTFKIVKDTCSQAGNRIVILDLTGGRKTMSTFLSIAFQLFSRKDDKIIHIEALNKELLKKDSEVWWPSSTKDINLLVIPMFRLDPVLRLTETLGQSIDPDDPYKTISETADEIETLALKGFYEDSVLHEMFRYVGKLRDFFNNLLNNKISKKEIKNGLLYLDEIITTTYLQNLLRPASGNIMENMMVKEIVIKGIESARSSLNKAHFLNKKGIRFEGDDFLIQCNEYLMKLVFKNLYLNSVSYAKLPITVRVDPLQRTLTWQDSGPGISKTDKEELFLIGGRKSEKKGRGIGIPLIKKILDWHGFKFKLKEWETKTVWEINFTKNKGV